MRASRLEARLLQLPQPALAALFYEMQLRGAMIVTKIVLAGAAARLHSVGLSGAVEEDKSAIESGL